MKFKCLWPLLLIVCSGALADEATWQRQLELGAVITTGNTEEENLTSKGDFTRESDLWRHKFLFDTLRSSKEDELTAQRFYGSYKLNYKFGDDRSFFTRISYEDDRFSGYEYQVDLTLGYGQKLITRENMTLEVDIGPGARWSKTDAGERETETILRLAGDFEWAFTENATFNQTVSTEIGEESTITRSVSALRTTISERFAMKLSYSVKHNSEVPPGTSNTDTETSITLVYSF